MRKDFKYWKIKKDNLTFQEVINLYQENLKNDCYDFAIYHSWDGQFDLHYGRLIGPDDISIEIQKFTLGEINATNWMLLEEDKETNKKLYEVYNYAIKNFNDKEYEELNLRDRDINELFYIISEKVLTIDDKVNIIRFLNTNKK